MLWLELRETLDKNAKHVYYALGFTEELPRFHPKHQRSLRDIGVWLLEQICHCIVHALYFILRMCDNQRTRAVSTLFYKFCDDRFVLEFSKKRCIPDDVGWTRDRAASFRATEHWLRIPALWAVPMLIPNPLKAHCSERQWQLWSPARWQPWSFLLSLLFPNKDAAGLVRDAFFSSSIEAKSSPPSVVDTSRALAESSLISSDPLSDYLCNALENIIIIFLHLPATTLSVGHCDVRVNKPCSFKLAIHCHRGTHPCTHASLQTHKEARVHTLTSCSLQYNI